MELLIFLVSGTAVLLLWLGWRPSSTWEQVSGWRRLSPAQHTFLNASRDRYTAETTLPVVTWQGHATLELEWEGSRLLIDPVAAKRIALTCRRIDWPAFDPTLPVAAICLTHAHMDHLDNASLARIQPTTVILPSGSERFLSRTVRERHRVRPLRLGEEVTIGALRIWPTPAAHGGWRYPWQRGLMACGYIVETKGSSVFLAGDSAAGPHFREIGQRYQPRLAVLPIGAYRPRWFLQKRHLNPEEAMEAARQLGVDYVVPCHFGTYRLSLEAMDEPLRWFARLAEAGELAVFLPLPPRPSGRP